MLKVKPTTGSCFKQFPLSLTLLINKRRCQGRLITCRVFVLQQNLEKAWLTHSFHCCAFKFPSRHDPTRHVLQLEQIEQFKSECKAKGYTHQLMQVGKHTEEKSDQAATMRKRRSAVVRLIRSQAITKNSSLTGVPIQPLYDNDDLGGYFHEPATVPNDYLEAICGNLTLK